MGPLLRWWTKGLDLQEHHGNKIEHTFVVTFRYSVSRKNGYLCYNTSTLKYMYVGTDRGEGIVYRRMKMALLSTSIYVLNHMTCHMRNNSCTVGLRHLHVYLFPHQSGWRAWRVRNKWNLCQMVTLQYL